MLKTNSTPKVLVVASLGPRPYVGGIENVVDTLINSQLKEAFEFSVFDTYRTPDPNRTRIGKAVFAVSLFARMTRKLQNFQPDLVHIHFCSKIDFWKHTLCLVASRMHRTRVVFHLHGGSFDRFYEAKTPPIRALIRAIFRLPDAVVALSSYWQRFLTGLVDAKKINIINNPVDCVRLAPAVRKPGANRRPDILLLGSLGKRKGHYDSLGALEIVLGTHPSARLLFAGAEEDPGATVDLKRICTERGLVDHVEFLGSLDFEHKLKVMHECAALVLPSYAENMPISVLEAMAAGTPVVASRVGAVPEALANGEAGCLIEAGDVRGLAEHIISILDNPERANEMAACAQRRARELWDVAQIAGRVGGLYRKVLRIS